MRISDRLLCVSVVGLALCGGPALAFDGNQPSSAAIKLTPMEAFRSGAAALKTDKAKAVLSLEYAAENGHPMAQWKLGRMYAEGDQVPKAELRRVARHIRSLAAIHDLLTRLREVESGTAGQTENGHRAMVVI